MPYPNEHAARLINPDRFDIFRRVHGGKLHGNTVPRTIDIIYGKEKGSEGIYIPQSLRFPVRYWTASQALEWLAEHDVNYVSFEPAE